MTETLAGAMARASRVLKSAGIPDAARDARALVAHAAGLPPHRVTLDRDRPLSGREAARLDAALTQRRSRRPVSQIVGARAFWGRDFHVTGDVLDPRPETETLVALALGGPAPQRLLDLGTGSGVLAITLLAEWPEATALATDQSAAALAVAAENARRFGVADRLSLVQGDWWAPVDGRFDLVISNPPYIPAADIPTLAPEVREWEPLAALDGGPDGLGAYRAIARGLSDHLAPGGSAIVEHGLDQGEAVAQVFRDCGLVNIAAASDLTSRQRAIRLHLPRLERSGVEFSSQTRIAL